MTNDKAIEVLKEIRTYAAPVALDAVEYAIEVLEKLNSLGITEPLELEDVTDQASENVDDDC